MSVPDRDDWPACGDRWPGSPCSAFIEEACGVCVLAEGHRGPHECGACEANWVAEPDAG